jgi:hypothetical protein
VAEKSRAAFGIETLSALGLMIYVPAPLNKLNYHGPENYSFFIALLFGCPLLVIQLVLTGAMISMSAGLTRNLKYGLRVSPALFPMVTSALVVSGFGR